MATTTWTSIRDNYITKILALQPSGPGFPFLERPLKKERLRTWAPVNGSMCFRRFEFTRVDVGEQPPEMAPDQYHVTDTAELVVSYPTALHNMFGDEAIDDLEDILERDANKLRDALFSSGNYISGHNMTQVRDVAVERDNVEAWFLVLTVEITYYKSQTLT